MTQPKQTMELTPEEAAAVKRQRESAAIQQAKSDVAMEILQVAGEYIIWLGDEGEGDQSFAAFCDKFGYTFGSAMHRHANTLGFDLTHIWKAICRLIETSKELAGSIEIAAILSSRE